RTEGGGLRRHHDPRPHRAGGPAGRRGRQPVGRLPRRGGVRRPSWRSLRRPWRRSRVPMGTPNPIGVAGRSRGSGGGLLPRRLVAAGAAMLLGGAAMLVFPVTSHADDAAFGSFSLSADAPGIHLIFDTQQAPAHPAGEGAFPKAYSSLEAGPIGFGLASVAWPGPLAGNLGSLIVLSGGPQQAATLNDSVKAETHAPGGPPDATYEQPGVSMQSHADPQLVTANASVSKTNAGTSFSVGNVDGASKVALGGTTGTAEGTSVVA